MTAKHTYSKSYLDNLKFIFMNAVSDIQSSFPSLNAKVIDTVNSINRSLLRTPNIVPEPIVVAIAKKIGLTKGFKFIPEKPTLLSNYKTVANSACEALNTKGTFAVPAPVLKLAIARVKEWLGLADQNFKLLKPVSLQEALPSMNLTTSSGFPLYTKKSKVIEYVLADAKTAFEQVNYLRPGSIPGFLKLPCTIATRIQIRKSGIKIRLIYVYPAAVTLIEQTFVTPLLQHFMAIPKTRCPYAIGNNLSDLVLFYNNAQRHKYVLSLDFSRYDLTVPTELIVASFSIIKSMFALNHFQAQIFDFIGNYFISCPILGFIDEKPSLFYKKRGIPSGSSFTNVIGTIANLLIWSIYEIESGMHSDPSYIKTLGDDIIIATSRQYSLIEISAFIKEKFGMELNVEKSEFFNRGEKVYFLGAYFDGNGRYIDRELTYLQMSITPGTEFVPIEDEMYRLWSKLSSICYKHTDGYILFDEIWSKIEQHTGVGFYSDTFDDLYPPFSGPSQDPIIRLSEKSKKSWSFMRYYGSWIQ